MGQSAVVEDETAGESRVEGDLLFFKNLPANEAT